jgi:NAD(P)-dependent dehydrogenase (short-subunit alcohol dehydrogenase family)
MLIEKSRLTQSALKDKTVILTGGGGGIGYETARALVWLGANVVIAEIDGAKGSAAQSAINEEFACNRVEFYEIDLSYEAQIKEFIRYAKEKYGFIDALFNNATMVAIGSVEDVSAAAWDKSYAVNFRAPLYMTQLLLPDMKARNSGAVIFVSSSGAAPYMGAYEVFKTAQVELSNTLSAELEATNIHTFTIGPGLVKTDTAMGGIKTIASLMGMSTDEFYKMNEAHMLSPEEAGAGFALAVVFAEKYRGQEVSSIQVLLESGMMDESSSGSAEEFRGDVAALASLISQAAQTFRQQYDGWMERNLFERQWVLRDFKKTVGDSAEQFKAKMQNIESLAQSGSAAELPSFKRDFEHLKEYYEHQYKLLQGFEKNPQKLKENSDIIMGWIKNIGEICGLL